MSFTSRLAELSLRTTCRSRPGQGTWLPNITFWFEKRSCQGQIKATSTGSGWMSSYKWGFLPFLWCGAAPTCGLGCPFVSFSLFVKKYRRRHQKSYDVSRRMAPIEPWRNSTPIFGAVAFCTTNIEDFRTSLMSTSSTISSTYSSQNRPLMWTNSKRIIMEVIEVDQLEDTNNERLSWAMPHSGLIPENEIDSKEEDDFWWKTVLDGGQPQKQRGLAHCWKAHGAGHIMLCGFIFYSCI